MKNFNWKIWLGLSLILVSAVIYSIQWAIFKDPHDTFFNLLGSLAFAFVQILLIILVVHQLLNAQEKKNRLEKLNVVIGAFMSELGRFLLIRFSDSDPNLSNIKESLIVSGEWSADQFSDVIGRLKGYDYEVDIEKIGLPELHNMLLNKRDFLLRLLENPTLLEHESFTDLIQATFHLTEELDSRDDLEKLPQTDYQHLAGDIKRVYTHLVHQWLQYVMHLKYNYPYLFSLAIRKNPFDESASAIVG